MQQNNTAAYLIIRQGSRWTDVFRLEPGRPLIIGRASSNEIPVPDERSSRRHAEIFYEDGWKVRDLGSRNGTFVDGQRIEAPQILAPGNQISVASCRMTFSHSLDQVAPPLDGDAPSPSTTQANQIELSAIVHRQSKSAILDPESVGLGVGGGEDLGAVAAAGKPMASVKQAPQIVGLLQLAFELARESDLSIGCDLALRKLMEVTRCKSAGVLRLNGVTGERSVIAARQSDGKAYHPASDTLTGSVLRDLTAVLARNIHRDANLIADEKSPSQTQASHVQSTSSAIVAPILEEKECLGFIHLYSRIGEPDLTAEDLEVALAIAEVVSTFICNARKHEQLEQKLRSTKSRLSELEQQLGHSDAWIGNSPLMLRVREQVKRVGPTQATILLRGESGSGKEVVARAIHEASSRAGGPFVALNCAALTPTLLESELFGHEKGAFTGATERKLGKFEQAHMGTIMLDELGEMSLEIQAKFLRILEGKPFERVGGTKPIQVDVRVIAATNKDLEQAVGAGEFRSDLYFRLRVIELRIPPLRERPEDIMTLATYFLNQFKTRSGYGPSGFSDRAEKAMLAYGWPGNVRELKNSVERAFVLALGDLAEPEDLALSNLQIPGVAIAKFDDGVNATVQDERQRVASPYRERSLDEVEQEHIAATLAYTSGQKNRAAAILGIERSTLDRKLKRTKND